MTIGLLGRFIIDANTGNWPLARNGNNRQDNKMEEIPGLARTSGTTNNLNAVSFTLMQNNGTAVKLVRDNFSEQTGRRLFNWDLSRRVGPGSLFLYGWFSFTDANNGHSRRRRGGNNSQDKQMADRTGF